ncbi:hypothetical protein L873DRAFT_503124 [Choiromyces venosus 120613-1]|uniref:Uncharacterized protein n=1 Tax=Choiromyces venosus 120613-1 TaxID=1336337 RepID=A0A3N4IWB5_9PEZI|nr:hypothetical protein L873DRAFT_503124 [Choiromyces venosus 120613-1]
MSNHHTINRLSKKESSSQFLYEPDISPRQCLSLDFHNYRPSYISSVKYRMTDRQQIQTPEGGDDQTHRSHTTPTPEIQFLVTQFNMILHHAYYLHRYIQTGESVFNVLTRLMPFPGVDTNAALDGMTEHIVRQIGKREYQVYKLLQINRAIGWILDQDESTRTSADMEAATRCEFLAWEILQAGNDDRWPIEGSDWFSQYMTREEWEELEACGLRMMRLRWRRPRLGLMWVLNPIT